MATSPRSSRPAEGSKTDGDHTGAAMEDLEARIAALQEEIGRLSRLLSDAGERSLDAARRAASEGFDQLRSKGDAAFEGLRTNARDLEQQVEATVREKPLTSLAVAAAVGFLVAMLARR